MSPFPRPPPTCNFSGLLVCLLLCAVASPASAEPSPESERWVPSLGISSGAFIQKSDGTLDSSATGLLSDNVLSLYPFMEGNFELMSPALLGGPVQPRLFLRGGVGGSWDALHRSPKQGDPGPLVLPNIGTVSLEAVQGRGAETRSQAKPLFYTASAGFALSLPFDEERALRLKSSVEYRYGATEIESVLSDAQSIDDDEVCPCRLGRLQATDEKNQHRLGMGIELELDAARLGPFLLAVHVGGQAHRLMDGRNLRVSASGFYDDGTPLDVTSETQLERWNFQLGVGLRFRWLPE